MWRRKERERERERERETGGRETEFPAAGAVGEEGSSVVAVVALVSELICAYRDHENHGSTCGTSDAYGMRAARGDGGGVLSSEFGAGRCDGNAGCADDEGRRGCSGTGVLGRENHAQ